MLAENLIKEIEKNSINSNIIVPDNDNLLCENKEEDYDYDYDDIDLERFQFYFAQLQDQNNWYNPKILHKIYKYAKRHVPISREQFEHLLNIATSSKKYKYVHEILDAIDEFSAVREKNWFQSVVPNNFLQRISIFLPHNIIFNIYRNCLLDDPINVSAYFIQTNIIEIIFQNLHKYESINLYEAMLNCEYIPTSFEQFLPQVVSQAIQNFNRTNDEHFLEALDKLAVKESHVQCIVQDPDFFSIFTHIKYSHYQRIQLLKFINSLCKSNKQLALLFATSPIWDFMNNSFALNKVLPIKEKKKMELNQLFFRFLYNVGEINEGRLFLYQNNVHLILFELTGSDQFQIINNSIDVLCQISLINDINVIKDLVRCGLINILTETLSCLNLHAQSTAINCIEHIERYGDTYNVKELVSVIFNNQELMEIIEEMDGSDDEEISLIAHVIYIRFEQWCTRI